MPASALASTKIGQPSIMKIPSSAMDARYLKTRWAQLKISRRARRSLGRLACENPANDVDEFVQARINRRDQGVEPVDGPDQILEIPLGEHVLDSERNDRDALAEGAFNFAADLPRSGRV
jgi:hypothetical protein